nr:vitamin B12-binding protein [Ligilactobacillus ruminis]
MQGRCRSICADGDLPVRGSQVLRADLKKRRFARKRELYFTGRFEKTAICP